MTISERPDAAWYRRLPGSIDWFLLLFLIGFCVDSVVVKPLAMGLALIGMWRSLPRLGYRDTPWFYLALPAMEIVRYLFFSHDFSAGRTVTLAIGCAYWIMGWLAFLIVRHRVKRNTAAQTIATMELWFWLNVICSLGQLVQIMLKSHSLNPFALDDTMYGNSTGDFIKGLFLAPCYLNMFVNTFFAVWFLYRRKWLPVIVAVSVCCLTTTNFANIIFLPVLIVLFFVLRGRGPKLAIAGSLLVVVAFYGLVANGNIAYLKQSVNNKYGSDAPAIAGEQRPEDASLSEAARLRAKDSAEREAMRIERLYRPLANAYGGKVLSVRQTFAYFRSSVPHALFGAGMGNFSSLLALQMAHIYGRKHSRFYERMPTYVHPAYEQNHFRIMRDVYDLPDGYHSARHMPHSFPNQLVGEYGLLGVLFFIFGYAWYFIKRGAARGSFLVILILTAGYLWFDYLFEYLSVMVFFELFFWQSREQKSIPADA